MIAYALLWDFPGQWKNDQNVIIFVKRKPNVRQRSFDDFLVGPALPLGPTPSANFTNERFRTSSKGPYICNMDFLTNHTGTAEFFP